MDNDSRFSIAIESLGKNFGVRGQIFQDKLEIFFTEFGNARIEIFERACRLLLENGEKFPTIKVMREFLASASRDLSVTTPIRKITPCDICDTTGYVSAVKDCGVGSGWCEYVFRCSCENGAYIKDLIPKWEKFKGRPGYLLSEAH